MEAARVASQALYSKKVFDEMHKMAKRNPVPALVNTVVSILSSVDEAMPGLIIDELFGVGMMMIVDAADAIQQTGIEVTEQHISQALSDAITTFLNQNPQRFSEEEVADAMQRLQEGAADLPDAPGGPAPGGPAPGGAPAGGPPAGALGPVGGM